MKALGKDEAVLALIRKEVMCSNCVYVDADATTDIPVMLAVADQEDDDIPDLVDAITIDTCPRFYVITADHGPHFRGGHGGADADTVADADGVDVYYFICYLVRV